MGLVKVSVARSEEARMDNRAVNQHPLATGKFSMLDGPTPETLQAANRAGAKVLSDMIAALGKWAIASFANNPISRPPQDMDNSQGPRVAAKL